MAKPKVQPTTKPKGAAKNQRPKTVTEGTKHAVTAARRRAQRIRSKGAGGHLGRPRTGVIVTGGASGIGRATALALAEAGRNVAIWDLDGRGAEVVAAHCSDKYGVDAFGLGLDVTHTNALDNAISASTEAIGLIGGLACAAGVGDAGGLADLTDDHLLSVLSVNLVSAAQLTRALEATLIASGEGAAICYVSSILAAFGNPFTLAYGTSKAGLVGLTKSMAAHFGPASIRVNAVLPGAVDTPMLQPLFDLDGARENLESRTPLKRLARPEEIASSIRFLLSQEASFITGTTLVVDGGMTAISGI